MNSRRKEGFYPVEYVLAGVGLLAVFLLCVCAGSVDVPVKETVGAVFGAISGKSPSHDMAGAIVVSVRLPRVICAALAGASLSFCGTVMQGLLRNPLADGSTLGVSSGAALGAALAILLGRSIPLIGEIGVAPFAMLFAFLSLISILWFTYKLDYSLSTNTIILTGIVFSMFTGAMINLVVAFSGDRVKSILFWTMGSLAGCNYRDAWLMLSALVICAAAALLHTGELNAFSIGEDNARNVGVNVKKVKLILLISVSALIGVCVSVSGTIGFAGLVIPHITRMLTGPNHKRLLPASLFSGAIFLMLADLLSRVIIKPLELPVGVVTSIIGCIAFVGIFYYTRRVRRVC